MTSKKIHILEMCRQHDSNWQWVTFGLSMKTQNLTSWKCVSSLKYISFELSKMTHMKINILEMWILSTQLNLINISFEISMTSKKISILEMCRQLDWITFQVWTCCNAVKTQKLTSWKCVSSLKYYFILYLLWTFNDDEPKINIQDSWKCGF